MFILFLVLVMANGIPQSEPILLDFQGMNHGIQFCLLSLNCHVNRHIGDIILLMTLFCDCVQMLVTSL